MEDSDGNILSQGEIDSLLEASQTENDTSTDETEVAKNVSECDFRRPKLITQERLNLFGRIHNTFCGHLQSELFQILHVRNEVTPLAFEQQRFKTYTDVMEENIYSRLLEISPFPGFALFEVKPSFLLAVEDILLGGDGNINAEEQSLTDTTVAVAEPVLTALTDSIKQTFSHLAEPEAHFQREDFKSEDLKEALSDIPVVALTFQISAQGKQDILTLCYPLPFAQYILDRSGREEVDSSKYGEEAEEEQDVELNMSEVVAAAPIDVEVILCESVMKVRDWLNLKKGDVIVSENKVESPATVKVGGKTIYYGRPGCSGEKRAIKIRNRIA